ncbi:hypothetical protein DICVIV_01790 [Dictyocaulus viviparus]|uniref:Uncharacterized protein n=1 Tax=Dictyocaulus viviparus TaxID=29172 RepID=A0A0D8Y5D4_DICVI|nr:hypothetical protein DICVIV_01790 [Dictyocaulus viviparus]
MLRYACRLNDLCLPQHRNYNKTNPHVATSHNNVLYESANSSNSTDSTRSIVSNRQRTTKEVERDNESCSDADGLDVPKELV